jgi:hypothetical protein
MSVEGSVITTLWGGPILALDQPGNEGAGFVIRPDGGAMLLLGNAGDTLTDPRLPGKSLPAPGSGPRSALVALVDPSGDQSLILSDGSGRPRLRLVTDATGGRIEFLDETGSVSGVVNADTLERTMLLDHPHLERPEHR